MPTLFRLLFVLALVGALVYGAMLALVSFGTPQQRQIMTPIELPKPGK